MALSVTGCKLPLAIFSFCLLWPCSYGVSPTISHANEPFILPHHFPTCIYAAFHSFIHTIPPHASYNVGSLLEKEALCGAPINGTTGPSSSIALRLRLLDSKLNSSKEVSGEALQRGFASLLEEFRRTLKLRYKWAVIMSGHYWVEYQSKSEEVGRRGSKSSATLKFENARGGGGGADQRKKRAGSRDGADMECLGRGDVLVSHNKKLLGGPSTDINGAGLDVLAAPQAIVAQNDEFYLIMQGDCNLVLYTAGGYPLWSSRSSKGKGSKCSLSLLADGNLVITNEKKKCVWESGSSIAANCPSVFILIMQSDGNLVIYDMLSGLPIWATGTNHEVEDVAGFVARIAAIRFVLPIAEQVCWDVKDAEARALIVLSVKCITPHIRSAKFAKQAWDTMAALYVGCNEAKSALLRKELESKIMNEEDYMDIFLASVKDINE
ncbi:hypothetical protein L7F22_048267 [Adiantum nelumboides]|nr:hypothetical protein [Adiantum nelumboides]